MKKVLVPVLSVALAIGSAGIGFAVDTCDGTQLVESIVEEYSAILTAEDVLELVELGYGYGEIAIAAALAEAAGVTLDEVIGYAEDGLGWGETASLLGIDVGKFGQNVRQLFAQQSLRTGNVNLEQEALLVREMVQTRLRTETCLSQPDAAATIRTRTESEKQQGEPSNGQDAKAGKGNAS